jgi:hypothetical protein
VWYYAVIGGERCPVVDTWWQTETGAIMISPLPGITPMKPGSATRPLPGVSASLLDENGNEVTDGSGLLVLTQPWPSMLRTLYDDADRYVETYFSRFGPRTYFVGDGARRDEDGYFWITGRPGPGRGTARARGNPDRQVRPAATGDLGRRPAEDPVREDLRRLLRDIADGRELGDVTTLGDPSVVESLQKAAGDGG